MNFMQIGRVLEFWGSKVFYVNFIPILTKIDPQELKNCLPIYFCMRNPKKLVLFLQGEEEVMKFSYDQVQYEQ
jgi:hypothetical protein